MFVSSGGGTVYTTDLKSVGASLTSSNLVWRIWKRLDKRVISVMSRSPYVSFVQIATG